MGFHQMSDPVGNHTSLTAARAGEQKKRAFDVCDSLLLLRIQTLQKVHGVGMNINFSMRLRKVNARNTRKTAISFAFPIQPLVT